MTATPPPAPDPRIEVGDVGTCPFCGGAIITTAGPHYCLARDVVARISTSGSTSPDTRPRCGGTPGKPNLICDFLNDAHHRTDDCFCKGCSDCDQPAPTPSGDDARETMKARAESDIRMAIEQGSTQFGPEIVLDALDAAAAALQEARERLAVAMNAWQETEARAGRTFGLLKTAEERLREVEGAMDRLERAAAPLRFDSRRGIPLRGRAYAEQINRVRAIIRDVRAASRPVPAAPISDEMLWRAADARGEAPTATPSTDEEGRA